MSNQLNLSHVDSRKVLKTSQENQNKQDALSSTWSALAKGLKIVFSEVFEYIEKPSKTMFFLLLWITVCKSMGKKVYLIHFKLNL